MSRSNCIKSYARLLNTMDDFVYCDISVLGNADVRAFLKLLIECRCQIKYRVDSIVCSLKVNDGNENNPSDQNKKNPLILETHI